MDLYQYFKRAKKDDATSQKERESTVTSIRATGSTSPSTSQNSISLSSNPNNKDNNSDSTIHRPSCWSLGQENYFKSQNSWLLLKDGKLGCNTCMKIGQLGVEKKEIVSISFEWTSVSVGSFGITTTQQQQSLRKKLYDHKNSKAHQLCEQILDRQLQNNLQNNLATASAAQNEETTRIFRTVYKIIKLNRPFSDLPADVDVQILNGSKMGRILHSKISCANICDHIGSEMKKMLAKCILHSGSKISIQIDESTSLSSKSCLIVFLRTNLDENSEALNIFLDIIELEGLGAEEIVKSLLLCLSSYGFDEAYLHRHLISIGTDGASTMLGVKAGVATILQRKFQSIVIWHCSCHRLELSVGNTVDEVSGMNNFKIFMDKLYCLYHSSPKNQRELSDCSKSLESQILKFGRILDSRWVSSSFNTIKAVWNSYAALYKHFSDAADDKSRDSKQKATFNGLKLRFSSVQFVLNLGMMFDALQELSELSREMQKQGISIIDAHRSICRQINVFESMVKKPGKVLKMALEAENVGEIFGVKLHKGRACDVKIDRKKFFESLVNNLKLRLLTTRSSQEKKNKTKSMDSEGQKLYDSLISEIKVLHVDYWPDQIPAFYGEDEIESLCDRFGLESRPIIREFREFRETGGKSVEQALKTLKTTIDVIPVSTSECERGFSQMNLIVTPARNSLSIKRLSNLLFVKLNGPPLKKFQAQNYAKSWIKQGHHSATDTNAEEAKEPEEGSKMESLWKIF